MEGDTTPRSFLISTFIEYQPVLSPDGKHFLMIKPAEGKSAATRINIILNWTEELKKLVPGD